MSIYETPRLLDEYLLFHYGTADEVLPWREGPREALGFPVRTVTELVDFSRLTADASALDLGCAVGRSSFELAKRCAKVIGIDFSQSFVTAAQALAKSAKLQYRRLDEAPAVTELVAHLPADVPSGRVQFEQGDAMSLRRDLGDFDVVHAANLLCRLPEPEKLMERLPALVKAGGQLVLTTPCTWLEEFTPKVNWPARSTREWLEAALAPYFELEEAKDMPFLIREHARKYQWSVAMGTRWVRRG